MLWWAVVAIVYYLSYIGACKYGLQGWYCVARLGIWARRLARLSLVTIAASLIAGFASGVYQLMIPAAVAAAVLVCLALPMWRAYTRFTAPDADLS